MSGDVFLGGKIFGTLLLLTDSMHAEALASKEGQKFAKDGF
jgi:hypothetical protein